MGVRRAVIERIFKCKTMNGAVSDAFYGSYANATAITMSGARLGQLVIASQAGVIDAIYVCKATGTSGTAGWTELYSG